VFREHEGDRNFIPAHGEIVLLIKQLVVNIRIFIPKDKSVPLEAWTGPEGSRKLRFPDFLTTAQDGGRLSALLTGRL